MNKPITSMNFLQPVLVGRPITSLNEGEGYEARLLDFPWIAVQSKANRSLVRWTTVFNVRDCELIVAEAPENLPSPPKREPKGAPASAR